MDRQHHLDQATKLRRLVCPNIPIMLIPSTLSNLVILDCSLNRHIDHIPSTLIHLQILLCFCTNVKGIPDTLTQLRWLDCQYTHVKSLPPSLTALESLCCDDRLDAHTIFFLSSSLKILFFRIIQDDLYFDRILNQYSKLEMIQNGFKCYRKMEKKWVQIGQKDYEKQLHSKLVQTIPNTLSHI